MDIRQKLEELFEFVPPGKQMEMLTTAIHENMTQDQTIQRSLVDTAISLRKDPAEAEKDVQVLMDEAVIVMSIEADESKYESYYLLVGMMEFLTYLARKKVDNQEMTPLEYVSFRNILAQIGFPHLGINSFARDLGTRSTFMEREIEAKEIARRQLLEQFADDAETMSKLELLGITTPLRAPMEEVERKDIDPKKFYDLIDEFCRFSNLGQDGAPMKVHFMKFVLDHIGIVPRLNAGYCILDVLKRGRNEDEKDFKERVAKECKNITRKISKELGDHAEANRFGLISTHFGELNITGIVPDTELHVLDKNPHVQAFMNNVRKGGRGQVQ